MLEISRNPDLTTPTPEQVGRQAFEDFIRFTAGTKESFSTSFKLDDQASLEAYGIFLYALDETINNWQEKALAQDDPHRKESLFLLDDAPVFETQHLNEAGEVYAVSYVAPPPLDLKDAASLFSPSVEA